MEGRNSMTRVGRIRAQAIPVLAMLLPSFLTARGIKTIVVVVAGAVG